MVLTTWLSNFPKQLTRRSRIRKAKSGLWSRSSGAAEVLEPRTLLAANPFAGTYEGTFSGTITIKAPAPVDIRGVFSVEEILGDNTFTAIVGDDGKVNVIIGGINENDAATEGTVNPTSGAFSAATAGSSDGFVITVSFTGDFDVVDDTITGDGTWSASISGLGNVSSATSWVTTRASAH